MLSSSDPTSDAYSQPYIYSSFDWSHCAEIGVDINALLDKLYSINQKSGNSVMMSSLLSGTTSTGSSTGSNTGSSTGSNSNNGGFSTVTDPISPSSKNGVSGSGVANGQGQVWDKKDTSVQGAGRGAEIKTANTKR